MPRKTRKEKKAAIRHNQLRFTKGVDQSITVSIPDSLDHKESSFKNTTQLPDNLIDKNDAESLQMRAYFLHDFKKSAACIAGIIALEICLYFASINHYLSSISVFGR